jgi:hypothetical protein
MQCSILISTAFGVESLHANVAAYEQKDFEMTEYISYKKLPNFPQNIQEAQPIVWTCNACGKEAPVQVPYNSLDNGLQLQGFSGNYGGFTDQIFHDNIEEFWAKDKAHFCHDCCVKLFKTFPYLAKALGINQGEGHHPTQDKSDEPEPCCPYSWKFGEGVAMVAAWDEDHHFLTWKEISDND